MKLEDLKAKKPDCLTWTIKDFNKLSKSDKLEAIEIVSKKSPNLQFDSKKKHVILSSKN